MVRKVGCKMGITNLNRQKSMVEILELEHENAKMILFDFVKYVLVTGTINAVLVTIALFLIGAYVHSGIYFFSISLVFSFIINDSIRKTSLKEVGGIVFDNAAFQNHSNSEEVYQATRIICEKIGYLKGRRSIVNMIHLFSAIMIIGEVAEYFMHYFNIY